MRRSFPIFAATAVAALCAFGTAAAQQNFPNRPMRIIVPNAPGGGTSTVARLMGEQLTANLGQQVIIDNRPGGNDIVAGDAAQRSVPDGHTLLFVTAAHAINPLLHTNPVYKAYMEFPTVATLVSTDYLLVVNAAVPATNLKEFIALAKSKPGQLNCAVSNAGGIQHLALEMINVLADVKIQAVPYKGGGPGMIDLIGGQVQVAVNNAITVMPHIKAGKIRALGIGGEKRLSALPNVPTFAEQGLQGYNVRNWFGIVAPPKTPQLVIDKLAAEIAKAQAANEFKDRLAVLDVEPFVNGPQAFETFIRDENAKYAKIIKAANIKIMH
jgi:tripartite-type tricarboxylate transporter receptor subunit TctC